MDHHPASSNPPAAPQEPREANRGGWSHGRVASGAGLDQAVDALVVGQADPRRYQVTQLLGRGGMGEVFLAVDERVGRSVALKVLLDMGERQDVLRPRFFREARVQGNLEHPGIVPVYDLDRDATGRDFFAMKRISGVTLERVVRDLAKRDAEAETKYPIRRLLAAFLQVCLAVDYAHSNGVVHRDLKLSNLMLGDFGEVYVLDWGVAKVLGVDEFTRDPVTGAESDVAHTNDDMLGTLGYMAPEQIRDSTRVDARADIYALGVILFTLLARERLHTQKTRADLASSTHAGADARASVRAPDLSIPPELDAICVKATALDPDQRYPNARALHDEVQRFLEGDRDMRLRLEVSGRHLTAAKRVLASTDDEEGGPTERRRRALQETARALAVSPESEEAATLMSSLMLNPPEQVPPEVGLEAQELSRRELARTGLVGAATLVGAMVFAVATLSWLGVRSWVTVGALAVFLLLGAVSAAAAHLTPFRVMPHVVASVFVALAIAMTSRIVGSLWIPPLFAVGFIAFMSGSHGLGAWRFVCFAIALAGVVVPWVLEATGVVPTQYVFEDGSVRIVEMAVELNARVTTALALLIIGVLTLCAGIFLHSSSVEVATRRKLQLMAWHLRQLAPAHESKTPATTSVNDADAPSNPSAEGVAYDGAADRTTAFAPRTETQAESSADDDATQRGRPR